MVVSSYLYKWVVIYRRKDCIFGIWVDEFDILVKIIYLYMRNI